MKSIFLPLRLIVVCVFLLGTLSAGPGQASPAVDPALIMATVNDEPITWLELSRTIIASHEQGHAKAKAGRVDFSNALQRMINTRLIVLEARNIGLDTTPGLTSSVESYARQLQMEMVLEQYVKDIRPDASEVNRTYESLVKEWKIRSLYLKKETDAKKIDAQLKEGKDFEQIAQRAMQWSSTESDPQGVFLKNNQLKLPVAQVIAKMGIGSVSPVLSLGKDGYIVFKLEATRIPPTEDPRARKIAFRQALNAERVKAARQYYEELKKVYVKVDQVLFDTLDYESQEQAMHNLVDDRRILVQIRDDSPITVAEFSQALKRKFYHGVKLAAETKRLNSKKETVLEDMIQKRLLLIEAREKEIDKSEEFKSRVKEYENSAIFDAFLKKVLIPEIRPDPKALEDYYKAHTDEYTTPQMMGIKDLVFDRRDDAVEAMQKLNKGTDFAWLSANAQGQVDPDAQGLINFEGRPLTISSLPQDIQKAVSGANAGDSRLYASPAGYYYLLYVHQIIAPVQQPFDAVKEEIAKQVFNKKIKDSIERWADQLSKYYPVKIFKSALAQLK
jgi:hypothetical protein